MFLLSDEPYRRLRFDGRDFTSPASFYPWTLISYSYGKVLLAPGQRLGYLAISPLMPAPEREACATSCFQRRWRSAGAFPMRSCSIRYRTLRSFRSIMTALSRRRDRLTATLANAGYEVLPPQGTFYLWVKWPEGDAERHWNRLADRDVFVLPGSIMNAPDYFRISLTASD